MTTERTDLPFDLDEATRTLAARDERLAELIATTRPFAIHADEPRSPYEALLRSIAYQSISGKAAETIFARVRALGRDGRLPTPEEMLRLRTPALRKAGLSAAKVLAMKDLARKTIDAVVPTLAQARRMSDEELVERLVSVRGIGVWSVEMFLIFRLGRPDVLPVHDLGVRKGWCVTYGKSHLPRPQDLLAFGERWRPYRSVASWYMWRAFERAGYAVTNKIGAAQPRARRTTRQRPAAGAAGAAEPRAARLRRKRSRLAAGQTASIL
ncbi:MAG: DNA-3-methyladenine glycosylase 2 family protein [Thermodesulfobacteriota bacterium]